MKLKYLLVYFFILLVGALLLYFSHPPLLFIGLIFISLIPLIFFIHKFNKKKLIFLGGFFYGFVYFLFLLNWILDVQINQISSAANNFYLLRILFFVLLVCIGAISFGIWGLLLKKFQNKSHFNFIFLGSFVFILLEYLRAFLVSLFFLGRESNLAPHWTFGHLGYGLINYSWISQLASLGGVYLLSFIVVFCNLLLFAFLRKKISKKLLIKFIMIFSLFLLLFNVISNFGDEKDSINIGVVQTSGDERAAVSQINNIINNNLSNSNIVVLPENIGSKYFVNKIGNETFFELNPVGNQMIIFSKYNYEDNLKNTIYYFDGEKYISYDKTFLMPFGEYMPYIFEIIYPGFNNFDTVNMGKVIKTAAYNENTIGALVCGAFMSPDLSRNLVKGGGSEIIVNLASNSAFGYNEKYRQINLHYSRLRALENNRYFVQSAHEGYSFIINNKGQIDYLIENFNSSFFDSKVFLIQKKTIYNLLGEWILILAVFHFIFESYLKSKKDFYFR